MIPAANPASLSSASQLIPTSVRSSLLKPEEKAERQRGYLWPLAGKMVVQLGCQQKGLGNLLNVPRVLGSCSGKPNMIAELACRALFNELYR